MKKYLSRIVPVFIVLWIFVYSPGIAQSVESADQIKIQDKKTETAAVKVGYLENVLFGKFSGKERINLIVSQQAVINVSTSAEGNLVVKLENMFVPDNLRAPLGEGELANIFRVTPQQQLVDGKQYVYLNIELKKNVPYAIRQEKKNIFIDFNTASLAEKKPVDSVATSGQKKKEIVKKEDEEIITEDIAAVGENVQEKEAKSVKKITPKRNTDRLITLDFQDADIKTVLRLMAEYGNTSIISGEDVKGKVTLTIKNTPWEQALDSILDTQGLAKKQMGDVISIMTLDRKKKDEADRDAAEKAQVAAEETRQARELKKLAEKGKLRQIMIEAKIVEASDTFLRNLGIQWGFINQQQVGSHQYGLGVSGGSNTSSVSTNSQKFSYPSEIPWYTIKSDGSASTNPLTMAAVNFAANAVSPTLGLVFGGAQGFIETQISAMETAGTGKVISSPKVVTMDGVPATIMQGDEFAYITPATGTTPETVTWKQAVLKLDVTPTVTEEGKISMKIKATNDRADFSKSLTQPTISKNEVDSKIVVQDGDTLVIGGVTITTEAETTAGIPWFYKIPVLGWLFKTENVTKIKKQLLIFITPKIVGGTGLSAGTQKTK